MKDYAISLHPDKVDSIKQKMLSPCINDYIENERIKTLAIASAWIGNDETHYVRKHENYGIDQLKAFITSIVTYIDCEISVCQAETLLNSSKNH